VIKFVIGLNIAIALLGFYVAWRIWHVRRELTSITVALSTWESRLHQALGPEAVPKLMLHNQQAIALTRQRYTRLLTQMHQLQRIFTLALMALRLWQKGAGQWRKWSRNR
jgi:hypothetical protein